MYYKRTERVIPVTNRIWNNQVERRDLTPLTYCGTLRQRLGVKPLHQELLSFGTYKTRIVIGMTAAITRKKGRVPKNPAILRKVGTSAHAVATAGVPNRSSTESLSTPMSANSHDDR